MNVDVIAAVDLDEAHSARWRSWQSADPRLTSPQLSVELLKAAAAVRPAVEVAVLSRGANIVGYLPWHRTHRNLALPVVDRFCDFQAPLLAPGTELNLPFVVHAARLRACVLREWWIDAERAGSVCAIRSELSQIDVRGGFEPYRRRQRAAGGDELANVLRKGRKIEREVGPLRFCADSTDESLLCTLLDWKARQCGARREASALSEPWQLELLRRLVQQRTDSCSGMLSALYVGDVLLAASFGIRSRTVYSGWITAYAERFARYSPGLLLLLALIRQAPQLGLERVDMGRGSEAYKRIFRTGTTYTGAGVVYADAWKTALHAACSRSREWVRQSRWCRPAQSLVRRLRWAGSRRQGTGFPATSPFSAARYVAE